MLSLKLPKSGSGEGMDVWDFIEPNRSSLKRLKQASVRNRSWFTVLSWSQRRIIDAVIETVDRIRSLLLLRILAPLVRTLLKRIGGTTEKGVLVLGGEEALRIMKGVAAKIVRIAKKWGNKSAHEWLDEGFIKYLRVMSLPQNKNHSTFTF